MSYTAKGTIHKVGETKQISEKFTKREVVISIIDNPKYPQMVSFELTKDRCSILDDMREGDEVSIEFNLRGREWRSPQGEVKYFNTLDVWKIAKTGEARQGSTPAESRAATASTPTGSTDDLPF